MTCRFDKRLIFGVEQRLRLSISPNIVRYEIIRGSTCLFAFFIEEKTNHCVK